MSQAHLDLIRDSARSFPVVSDPDAVRSARVWYCKYKSLASLAELRNLEELVIAGFPDESFEFLGTLEKLRLLNVLHLPKITSVTPLSKLSLLETLSLSTLPSWDASRKITIIESLEPLADIPALAHLELFGVCPPDKSLVPIERCKHLRTARFSQYPAKELARFYERVAVVNKFNPKPSFA
jgi:hypothetical protein